MIQLYTKNIDRIYEKVNWKNLKVTPNVKIKEAIDRFIQGLNVPDDATVPLQELKKELGVK